MRIHLLHLIEDLGGIVITDFCSLSRQRLLVDALEQSGAELLFQFTYRVGNTWLSYMKLAGGSREIEVTLKDCINILNLR